MKGLLDKLKCKIESRLHEVSLVVGKRFLVHLMFQIRKNVRNRLIDLSKC